MLELCIKKCPQMLQLVVPSLVTEDLSIDTVAVQINEFRVRVDISIICH